MDVSVEPNCYSLVKVLVEFWIYQAPEMLKLLNPAKTCVKTSSMPIVFLWRGRPLMTHNASMVIKHKWKWNLSTVE